MKNAPFATRYCPNPACHRVLDSNTVDPCPSCRRADPLGNLAKRRRNFLIVFEIGCIAVAAATLAFVLFYDVI